MSSQSQISATVSVATKEKLDRFSESHGLKKNFVVEQALLYFMEARRELPDEALLPARLVVEDQAHLAGGYADEAGGGDGAHATTCPWATRRSSPTCRAP